MTIETAELGGRSYVIGEGGAGTEALVIDPQRDLDRVEPGLSERGWTCALVLDTHLHNDYVSGGLELARRAGAAYGLQAREQVAFDRCAIHDGDILSVGTLEVHLLEPPGTPRITCRSSSVTTASRPRCSRAGRCSTAASEAPTWSPRTVPSTSRTRSSTPRVVWRTIPTTRRSTGRTVRVVVLGRAVQRRDQQHHRR